MVFVNALKGAGDTRFVLHVSLVMAVLLAGLSWCCVEVLQLSVYGCWALITLWVWTMGLVFMFRFLRGNWRKMRVIEMRGTEDPHAGECRGAGADRLGCGWAKPTLGNSVDACGCKVEPMPCAGPPEGGPAPRPGVGWAKPTLGNSVDTCGCKFEPTSRTTHQKCAALG